MIHHTLTSSDRALTWTTLMGTINPFWIYGNFYFLLETKLWLPISPNGADQSQEVTHTSADAERQLGITL